MPSKRPLLPSAWEVPQVFRDRLGERPGRQRAMLADGHLLLILHEPPGEDHSERGGRFFWRQPDGTWQASSTGTQAHSLDAHLAQYEKIVDGIDERDPAEENAVELHADITALAPLVRATRNMHAALQQARELCHEVEEIIVYRDRTYQIERMAELAYQDARNTLGYTTAVQAEAQATSGYRMAVSAHRLNLLAAFFFPVATLSAIFGIDIDPFFRERSHWLPFSLIVVTSLACGLWLKWFVTSEVQQPGKAADQ